jgi:hypothetical protein
VAVSSLPLQRLTRSLPVFSTRALALSADGPSFLAFFFPFFQDVRRHRQASARAAELRSQPLVGQWTLR